MTVAAGWLLITGSVVFLAGASVGVPRVFVVSDRQARRDLLNRHRRRWRVAQPLYAGGPVLAAVGDGLLAAAGPGGVVRGLPASAALFMLIGASTWSYSCLSRGTHPAEFALGTLPTWPFTAYVLATIAGIGLLAGGLLAADYPGWLGWSMVGADLAFLVFYAATNDIPPFAFYLLLLAAGVVLVVDPGS